jgi:hypothetical protein
MIFWYLMVSLFTQVWWHLGHLVEIDVSDAELRALSLRNLGTAQFHHSLSDGDAVNVLAEKRLFATYAPALVTTGQVHAQRPDLSRRLERTMTRPGTTFHSHMLFADLSFEQLTGKHPMCKPQALLLVHGQQLWVVLAKFSAATHTLDVGLVPFCGLSACQRQI